MRCAGRFALCVVSGVALATYSFAAQAAAAGATAAAAPDISGTYWTKTYSPTIPIVGGGAAPLNAAGLVQYERNQAGLKDGTLQDNARRICLPDGVPRVLATPYPFEIFQVPAGRVTIVYEMNHQVRVIEMDQPVPTPESLVAEPLYNGHSVGHYEGDTLVVETLGYNDITFLDASGLPHSDALRTTERIRRVGNELEILVTISDPAMYAREFQARFAYDLRNDVRLEEYACNDTHRDLSSVAGAKRN